MVTGATTAPWMATLVRHKALLCSDPQQVLIQGLSLDEVPCCGPQRQSFHGDVDPDWASGGVGFFTIRARSLSRDVNWGLDGQLVKGRDMPDLPMLKPS